MSHYCFMREPVICGDDKAYVIEINDNPSIDHELEDAIIGDEMYYRLLNHFEQALEMKHY